MLLGALARFVPWSAAERATLREAYATGGLKAARAALPHRSEASIFHKADRLHVERRRRWTNADVRMLRNLWGVSEVELRDIAERLGRTKTTVYYKARELGLPCGCPDGWEYMSHAAARTGFQVNQLRRILADAGMRPQRALSNPSNHRRGRRHGAQKRAWIIMPECVDAAVARWLDAEPLNTAAKRLGVCGYTLAQWLRLAGVKKPSGTKKHWRVTTREVEAAISARCSMRSGRYTSAARRMKTRVIRGAA